MQCGGGGGGGAGYLDMDSKWLSKMLSLPRASGNKGGDCGGPGGK